MFNAAKKKFELMKVARQLFSEDGGSFDQALAVAEEFGLKVKFDEIPCEVKPAAEELDAIATAAVQPGAKFFRAELKKEGYPAMVMFVVLKGA